MATCTVGAFYILNESMKVSTSNQIERIELYKSSAKL